MVGGAGGGAHKAYKQDQRSSLVSMVQLLVQPVAMGVLLGQGWHVYSEVFHRGTLAGFGICCAGALLGVVCGTVLTQRAAPGQAAVRLSLFWMSCTLNGGLSGIAQLRQRVGRFRANDDALVVNSFLSSGLLGTALPHIAMKLVKQPGAEIFLPCVFAVLLTETICKSEALPTMQVAVSFFLLAVGLRGIAFDTSLPHGSGEVGRGNERHSGSASANVGQNHANHEPFRPATAIDKRSYSPHFLVSRKPHSVPNGTSVVPLISLVARQASEPSRGGGKSGGKDRGKESRGSKNRVSNDEVVQSLLEKPRAAESTVTDAEEVVRQKGTVSVAEVGSDIRWDVLLEEMQRVDGGQTATSDEIVQPSLSTTRRKEMEDATIDGPVEVFAELAVEGVDDVGDLDGEEEASNTDQPKVAEVELTMQQRWEQALAHAREFEAHELESHHEPEKKGDNFDSALCTDPREHRPDNEDEDWPCEVVDAPHDEERLGPQSNVHLEKRETGHMRGDKEGSTPPLNTVPGSGLKLIECNNITSPHGASDEGEPEDDFQLGDDVRPIRPLSPHDATEISAHRTTTHPLWNAGAEEFVPVAEVDSCTSKVKLRPEAAPFQPGSTNPSLSLFADDCVPAVTTEAIVTTPSLSLFADDCVPAVTTKATVTNPSLSLFADDCVPAVTTEAIVTKSSLSLFADDCLPVTSTATVCEDKEGKEGADVEDYTHLSYAPTGTWPHQDMEWDPSHAATYAGDSWDRPWDDSCYSGDGAWDSYGAYGNVGNQDYAYNYQTGMGDSYMNMSVDTAEYANMWGGHAVSGQDEMALDSHSTKQAHQIVPPPSEDEPTMSLLDPEEPDPGCGRASTVRRLDTFEERKGKGKSGWSNREAQQRTLWVGDVDPRMSETAIWELFAAMALVTGVKVFRDRGYGENKTCYAFVEFASQSAAIGVLEALKGEPIVTKDGHKLRVNWATPSDRSENRGSNHEVWNSERSDGGKGSDGKGGDRRMRRDKGDGKGDGKGYHEGDGREAYWNTAPGGKGDSRKGKSKGKGEDTDGPSERSRTRTDARPDGRSSWGDSGGDVRNAQWAYVDPHGEVQIGFSSEQMRTWYELDYFEPDMLVAILPEGGAQALEGRKPKAPPRREFYKLRQWFRNLDKAFTYVPKF